MCDSIVLVQGVGLPRGSSGKESACQCQRCRRYRFDPWVRKISWRRKWQPIPYSCLENPMNRGTGWVTVHGVSESDVNKHTCSLHSPRYIQNNDLIYIYIVK